MNTITLSVASTGWVATYTGPHAAEIRELFGSPTIPTVFTRDAAPEAVRAFVAARNPTVRVLAPPARWSSKTLHT